MDTLTAFDGAPELIDAWYDGLRDEPLLSVSDWCDRNRYLSTRASAEPGIWQTSRTPYLREIMDCLSPTSPVERVVFMKGAQIGGTEAGNNWLGYVIDQAPGPMMMVMPTGETAVRTSKQRIAPLIEDSPALRGKVRAPMRRDSGNTLLSKEFPGGILIMTGANSAVGLRSMPVRYLFMDEVDGFPHDAAGEGDPVDLATKRTVTFARRKILMVSTPTLAGSSRVEAAYQESDQRRYFVACPDCDERQALTWAGVRWPKGQPEAAAYQCEGCGALWPEHAKHQLLAGGEWRAGAEGDGKTAGFHLSGLYSPWFTWAEAAADFIKAKDSPERLQPWVNTVLGETWAEPGEIVAWQALYDRRENYQAGVVPAGALYLTAGVDVQRDRLEVEIVGWGPDSESWSIDYRVLVGDPYHPEVWHELDRLLDEPFKHEAGAALTIGRLAVDAGFATQTVYEWSRTKSLARVMAIKGATRQTATIGSPSAVELTIAGKRRKTGAKVWPINVDVIKAELYGRLRVQPPREEDEATPPGLCHFPAYDAEYFKQLTAEQQVERKDRRGFPVREWQKIRARNEALDCRVYATAAAMVAGVPKWREGRWAEARQAIMNGQPRPEQRTRRRTISSIMSR